MLRQFTVNNFKSLVNVVYEPGVVNLLIGMNNSGKTNLCQALRFLSQTAQGYRLIAAWHNMGGPGMGKNVYFDHPTVDLDCICDLAVEDEGLTFHYSLSLGGARSPVEVATEQLYVSGKVFGSNNVSLLENKGGALRLLNETQYEQNKPLNACYQDTTAEASATMLSRLHDLQANRRAIAFRDYLASWQYYDLDVHRLRDDRLDPDADALGSDGANLASALFSLKSRDERSYRRLVKLVQQVEQRLDALNFTTVGDRIRMELTDRQDHRFGPASISSGTLRFMALCYIILNNARQSNPPLTIIEEPENGLYVRYLKPLFELIDSAGSSGQYIFTSHSPYFIDLFDARLEDVVLMENKGTYSALRKLDPARVRAYLEEMPLGELHFREMLA